jgi:hypothetical protein
MSVARSRFHWLLAIAFFGVMGVACGNDTNGETTTTEMIDAETTPTTEPGTGGEVFVGSFPVARGPAYIAVVSDAEQVSGFVCLGNEAGIWFEVVPLAADGSAELLVRRGSYGHVSITDDMATGQLIIPGGNPLEFSAAAARGDAGLYQAVRDAYEIGWIVLSDGSQCGVTTHEGAIQTNSFPAPPLDPGAEAIEISNPRQLELGVVKVTTPADIE